MVELIVTAINVFILFFLIGYLVSDMLSGMLTKRQERIADDINTARMSKEEALALKNDYEHRLADFESERADILENTRRKAAQMEERILLDGQQEADRVIARAKREAELKKTKLKEDVRHDMIMAASITACKLAAETLDDKKQAVYIQEMLDEMAAMGEKTFRGKQIYQWLHEKLVSTPDEMGNIPAKLKDRLKEWNN